MAVPDNIRSRGASPGDGEPREAPDTLRHRPDTEGADVEAGRAAADSGPVTVRPRAAADDLPADATGTGGPVDRDRAGAREARGDRSPWNWLLIVAIIVPLLTPLFNSNDPTLLGFPRFYWLQLAFIILGVAVTTIVYQATKRRR